jgi:hypothetical protein
MSLLALIYWVVLIVTAIFGFVTMTPNSPYSRYATWPAVVLFIIIGLELFTHGFSLH